MLAENNSVFVASMLDYPVPKNEAQRLAALHQLKLLDTPDDPVFDRVTRLVTRLLDIPTAIVTLIDADRQWIKSRVGFTTRETPRSVAFCSHTIAEGAPLVVEDARQDPRFSANPLVDCDNGIRFYAGIPLLTSEDYAIGSLCAMDTQPRYLHEDELSALKDLTAILNDEICLREHLTREQQRRAASQRELDALHKSLEEQIERRTRELNLVIEAAYDAYISVDDNHRVLDWNRAAAAMFGWTRQEALGQLLQALIFPHGVPEYDDTTTIEVNTCRRDGREMPVEVRVKSLCVEGKHRYSLFVHDIAERRQLEQLRDREAREDALTLLPNRRALDERLFDAMARARRLKQPLAVLFLDLDGFKAVNDEYGHAVGDELLREIGKRLRHSVRETDYVARWAGDEFVMVLEGMSPDAMQGLGEKLIHTIEAPIRVGELSLYVSTSIGVAIYRPVCEETAQELLKRADVTMYDAKHAGKAQVKIAQQE
ncbi:sensor domain-containing diguanylate cyclase [Halomonas llamarensis]|uniref:Diguanylate cyclase n=1 Tax=Halomonas llamarensis TaxID=2945104 RepID=A0ABT0STJ2_9GAMM|nr:diguanylate cyclase [Halomonas llamarensis]MCL7931042.1 diguanylate cyclase [Halomonas llamarensis]